MKNQNIKIFIVLLIAAMASCSNDNKLAGKNGSRTMPGVAERGSLPEQMSSNDGTGQIPSTVKGSDPIITDVLSPYVGSATGALPAEPPAVINEPPACNGVVINNSCQPIVAIHRCRSNVDIGFYTNHIYPSDMGECTRAGYLSEGQPYFYSLPGMDKSIIRWHRTGLSGHIQHYYLQPGEGEALPSSYPMSREGEAFRISGSDFVHPRKVALYRCVVNCAVLANHPSCDQNMQWISTDINCEGNGVGSGAILGYGIAP